MPAATVAGAGAGVATGVEVMDDGAAVLFDFRGAPTGTAQSWPGWPWAGFRPAAALPETATGVAAGWLGRARGPAAGAAAGVVAGAGVARGPAAGSGVVEREGAAGWLAAVAPGSGAPTGTAQLWPGCPCSGLRPAWAPAPAAWPAGAVGKRGAPGLTSTTLLFFGSEQLKSSRAAGMIKNAGIFMIGFYFVVCPDQVGALLRGAQQGPWARTDAENT